MSLIDNLAFVRTQQQDAESSRVTLDAASRRFGDDVDAARATWADEAARGVFTRYVDPYSTMLDTVARLLRSAEQAQSAGLMYTQHAVEAAEFALAHATGAVRQSEDIRDQASYAMARARDARTAGDQVEAKVVSIRATLAGIGH